MSRVLAVSVLVLVLASPLAAQDRGAGMPPAPLLRAGAQQQPELLRRPAWERQVLQRLTLRAAAQVRQAQGPQAAQELLAPVRRLQRQAAIARQAGNPELARRRMLAAQRVRGRIVVEVLGAAGEAELRERAERQSAELAALIERRLALGEDVRRLRMAQRLVNAQLRQGQRAFENDRLLRAMVSSARAVQLARRALARAG